MKRKALTLILITVVTLSIAAWVVYSQISAPNVRITAFDWIGGFNPVGGLTIANQVQVTIKNMGGSDISGLTLTVKMVYVDTQTEVGQGYTEQIDVIHAGETLEFPGEIWTTMGSWSKESAMCVSTLSLGDVVLDEWIEPFTN